MIRTFYKAVHLCIPHIADACRYFNTSVLDDACRCADRGDCLGSFSYDLLAD